MISARGSKPRTDGFNFFAGGSADGDGDNIARRAWAAGLRFYIDGDGMVIRALAVAQRFHFKSLQ